MLNKPLHPRRGRGNFIARFLVLSTF